MPWVSFFAGLAAFFLVFLVFFAFAKLYFLTGKTVFRVFTISLAPTALWNPVIFHWVGM
jgi:hypothetical protein